MMPRTDIDHLPWPIQHELRRITAMVFEAFEETTKGRLSEHYRAGRILTLILHGPHTEQDWQDIPPGDAFRLLAIVNYPRLARGGRDWGIVRDRLRRAWECGEITRPVRLSVESLERVNNALIDGVPYFVTIADKGIALYQAEDLRLRTPRPLSARERSVRGLVEFIRRYQRGSDFLLGAAFYRDKGNAPMAALLLHQACEHFYLSVLWSHTLHGPRTHALDELRETAEAMDPCLAVAWPRDTPFERRAFFCIRRAYVEARYGRSYRITRAELAWAFGRIGILREQASKARANHQAALIPVASVPARPSPEGKTSIARPLRRADRELLRQHFQQIAYEAGRPRFRWNRLIPDRGFWRSECVLDMGRARRFCGDRSKLVRDRRRGDAPAHAAHARRTHQSQ